MKIGIIISQADPETAWNAFRFGNFSIEKGHAAMVFLIGKGVECEEINNKDFDVKGQMKKFVETGGKIFTCGTCLKARNMKGSAVCPISTMQDMMDIVEKSDRIVSF